MYTPDEILDITIQMGKKKIAKPLSSKLLLGFVGGAMISLGYLAYIRVASSMIEEWGSFASFIGACVFPIGLIVILLGGGELITGNMMAVSAAWLDKKVTMKELLINWLTITVANIVGALFVAYFFGHIVGLTSSGAFLHETVTLAQGKVAASPLQAFISGIGCNWFVGLALWLCYGAKDASGKMLGIWFPVMTFVAIGFQHSVANLFVIPAAIFEGGATWSQLIQNFVPVYLGNIVGGAVFVSALYYKALKH
ncbi:MULTISPECIES: formate/nitrite transporter family protein [Carnobacterium]|uniref:formate/nitrite transporter family protein n=1 Tax=Carnobacterium TaxID=2747 RepID=UPI000D419E92|nr:MULTISPECIES: formate/nitrite transporter family protein [Carnobacterium]MCO6016890.1 formate/nitrite transporter family protein [Carnobacterium divergens]MDT1940611.1 formate/nitrite transporter family protein [Carnobacterium divergens]MDT1943049.1 formate/nitrite transporter family protein [Carnobacterium divergens]MDT1948856.1 formate/nitrite transporter family protein [Carnobacterium divergens]MDT1951336.1 formate/nitrite transporter family protein [Carnobacterium divergens]